MSTRVGALPVMLVAALLIAPGPAATAGGGASVTAAGMSFSPERATVTLGESVTWTFPAEAHTTTSDQGFWDSGSRSGGDTYARAFTSAGTYRYHCSIHPQMTGSVRVPLGATGSATEGWRLRWATGPAPDGRDFDVQVRRKGADRWTWFRRDAEKAAATFDPARTGTWKVRARTSNTDAASSSGWSPVRRVKVS